MKAAISSLPLDRYEIPAEGDAEEWKMGDGGVVSVKRRRTEEKSNNEAREKGQGTLQEVMKEAEKERERSTGGKHKKLKSGSGKKGR